MKYLSIPAAAFLPLALVLLISCAWAVSFQAPMPWELSWKAKVWALWLSVPAGIAFSMIALLRVTQRTE